MTREREWAHNMLWAPRSSHVWSLLLWAIQMHEPINYYFLFLFSFSFFFFWLLLQSLWVGFLQFVTERVQTNTQTDPTSDLLTLDSHWWSPGIWILQEASEGVLIKGHYFINHCVDIIEILVQWCTDKSDPSICGHYMSELCTWSWPSQQLDEVQVILPILQMRTLRPSEVVNECIQGHTASRRQI